MATGRFGRLHSVITDVAATFSKFLDGFLSRLSFYSVTQNREKGIDLFTSQRHKAAKTEVKKGDCTRKQGVRRR